MYQDILQIDPQLFFERLLAIAQTTEYDLKNAFQYEFIELSSTLRLANKPALTDAILKLVMKCTRLRVMVVLRTSVMEELFAEYPLN